MSDGDPWQRFPSFAPLFGDAVPVPLYLQLLNLDDPGEGQGATEAIRRAIRQTSNLEQEVVALMEELDWRPNLVGATAVALGAASSRALDALWASADRGSWVSPQLAAVASVADPDFLARARTRIERGCPLASLASPDGELARSSKMFKALVALVESSAGTPPWLMSALARDDLKGLLADDVDGGGQIALSWIGHLRFFRSRLS